jgi:hypothetical protein
MPPLFLYFLFFVTVAGKVGVTSMLSSEVEGKPLLLEVVVSLLSLEVRVVHQIISFQCMHGDHRSTKGKIESKGFEFHSSNCNC